MTNPTPAGELHLWLSSIPVPFLNYAITAMAARREAACRSGDRGAANASFY
jgi:hypothetical protein